MFLTCLMGMKHECLSYAIRKSLFPSLDLERVPSSHALVVQRTSAILPPEGAGWKHLNIYRAKTSIDKA